MKVTEYDIEALIPDPENTRSHPSDNTDALRRSIKRFGIRKPIVAHEGTKIVYAGNETLRVAIDLGFEKIPVAWIPKETDEATCKAYAIADNRTTDLSDWNLPTLESVIDDLQELDDFELEDIGFNLDDLDDLFGREKATEVEEDDFDTESALQENAVSQMGDLWHLREHRLICGDSFSHHFEYGDFAILDPPYDSENFQAISQLLQIARSAILFGSDKLLHEIARISDSEFKHYFVLLFDFHSMRSNRPFVDRILCALYNNEDKSPFRLRKESFSDVIHMNYRGHLEKSEDRELFHAHEKEVKVIADFIKHYSDEGDTIIDPFAGSGTTFIACEQLKRRCYGVEMDGRYVDVCVKRWAEFVGEEGEIFCERDGEKITFTELFD